MLRNAAERKRARAIAQWSRLGLVEGGELLLELREEVLAAGHEVWHVSCTRVRSSIHGW